MVKTKNTVTHRGCRGARPARREEGEYREYLTDEQHSRPRWIGIRMPSYLWFWPLRVHRASPSEETPKVERLSVLDAKSSGFVSDRGCFEKTLLRVGRVVSMGRVERRWSAQGNCPWTSPRLCSQQDRKRLAHPRRSGPLGLILVRGSRQP